MTMPRPVAVLGGVRIPFARQNGPYARASNQDMLTATLDALVSRCDLEGQVLARRRVGPRPLRRRGGDVDDVPAAASLHHRKDLLRHHERTA